MDFFTAIIVYFIVWWLLLFTVLPWGNKVSDEVEKGNVSSAPENPRLKQKFLITSVLSLVILIIIYTLVTLNVIDFRELARQMFEG